MHNSRTKLIETYLLYIFCFSAYHPHPLQLPTTSALAEFDENDISLASSSLNSNSNHQNYFQNQQQQQRIVPNIISNPNTTMEQQEEWPSLHYKMKDRLVQITANPICDRERDLTRDFSQDEDEQFMAKLPSRESRV